jgi:hypothetical protein
MGDAAVEADDLPVVGGDHVPEGLEAMGVGHGQLQGVELGIAPQAEHVDRGRHDAVLAHHGVHLGFEA